MAESVTINPSALEPLFKPWEEPNRHRVKGEKNRPGVAAKGRRPSRIAIVQNLRSEVRLWREGFYAGVSDTTRHLLNHWFGRAHRITNLDGSEIEFQYYFCQREAIETLIYLKEMRKLDALSQIVADFGGPNRDTDALGITE